jgi:hypothetical protein
MLHLVGLGLADETDITVKGLEVVKRADRVYLEAYTSILLVDKEKLVRWSGQNNSWHRGYPELTVPNCSRRKHSMEDLSFSRTAKWSSHRAMIS